MVIPRHLSGVNDINIRLVGVPAKIRTQHLPIMSEALTLQSTLLGNICKYVGTAFLNTDRDSSVGIVTRYGLDGPGIEIPVGGWARFSAPFQTGPRDPSKLLYNGYRVFPRGKAAGAWC